MKIGKLLTTTDIQQKMLMGELNGNEIWSLESNPFESPESEDNFKNIKINGIDTTVRLPQNTRKGCGCKSIKDVCKKVKDDK